MDKKEKESKSDTDASGTREKEAKLNERIPRSIRQRGVESFNPENILKIPSFTVKMERKKKKRCKFNFLKFDVI